MRAQAIAIFLTVVVALVGVSYYQVGAGVSSDAKALGEAAARSQIAALIPAFLSEFKIINEQFDLLAPRVFAQPGDFSDAVTNRFEMMARLQLGANGVWSIQNRAFHDKTRVKSWAENYTQIALKGLKPRDIPLGGTALTALLDPQRRPFFLWIMRGNSGNDWSAVITKTDVFQAIIDRQRGQNVSIFLVNKQGQALSHTTADYIGTTLKDDPIVSEISRGGKSQGVGTFRTANGAEVQGLYEQVPGSNSYVVLSRPLTALNDRVASLRLQILLFGGGFAFLGVAVMMLALKSGPTGRGVGGPSYSGVAVGGGSVPPPGGGVSTSNAGASSAPVAAAPAADLAREKMKAYTTSASALAREMHGPLTRILSQAQLLKAKSINEEEVTRIEELARQGRNVVLKLLSFAGEEEFRAEPTSLNEVLTRTLGLFESRFQMKGIKVEKNLKRMPEVAAHPLALMKIFEALFNNAIEAMERMPRKELSVDLATEGADVVVKIQDSGEGVAADRVGMVFDPFFTTKNPSQHSGLGLSTAYGLAREFGGDLKFVSQAGQGTTVTLRFPVGASASPTPTGLNLDELPPVTKPAPMASLGVPVAPQSFPGAPQPQPQPAAPAAPQPQPAAPQPQPAAPAAPAAASAPTAPSAPSKLPPASLKPAKVAAAPDVATTPTSLGVPSALSNLMKTPPLPETSMPAPTAAAPEPLAPTAAPPLAPAPKTAPPIATPLAPAQPRAEAPPPTNFGDLGDLLDVKLSPPTPASSTAAASGASGAPQPGAPKPQPAAPAAPQPQPAAPAAHNAPLSGIGMNLPPNPGTTPQTAPTTPRAPAARPVPRPAGPGGVPAPADSAVAQKPPASAPLPPRTAASGAGPVTVTPAVPLGVGLELSGELAPEKAAGRADRGQESVIQERAINETLALIDQVENGPLSPSESTPSQTAGSPPSAEGPSPENTGFGKIDKPTFAGKKPTARVAGTRVAIRKPGERK